MFFTCFWKQGWQRLLKIREVAQHARCVTCARLQKTVRTAPIATDRLAAEAALVVHRQRNFADRAVDFRLSTLSEESVSADGGNRESRVLHIRIDGMDQAKFRCPRNLENSKGWANLWRPTLHCVGVVVEGVLACYYLTDQDVKKDSNLELTSLTLALDRTLQLLQGRGLLMPEHLSLTYDNTAREGKNQHMAKWMAWLVAQKWFRSCQDGNGMVGHTHNKMDQRFSIVGGVLSRQTVLQTPADFMTVIQQHVRPGGNRVLHVQKISAAWNWQEFFSGKELLFSGIAACKSSPDVCHSKRFVLRRDLPKLGLPDGGIVTPLMFHSHPVCPDDVVMLTKEFWSNSSLAHPPMLVWDSVFTARLAGEWPQRVCSRNKLSKCQLLEFRKTALKVQAPPWNLTCAGAYLTQWCDLNEQGTQDLQPPPHVFFRDQVQKQRWHCAMLAVADTVQSDTWLQYAPGAPVQIEVHPAARKRSLTAGLEGAKDPRGKADKTSKMRKVVSAPVTFGTVGSQGGGGPFGPRLGCPSGAGPAASAIGPRGWSCGGGALGGSWVSVLPPQPKGLCQVSAPGLPAPRGPGGWRQALGSGRAG